MFEQMARFGYACKAAIYAIVGSLALAAAANRGGRITDTSGALRVVLGQPFGRIVPVVLAVGLCGYALWRIADAIFDPERHGTGFGVRRRLHHGDAAPFLDPPKSLRPVRSRAGENYTDRVDPVRFGQRLEEQINWRTAVRRPRPRGDAQLTVHHRQVSVGREDVDEVVLSD